MSRTWIKQVKSATTIEIQRYKSFCEREHNYDAENDFRQHSFCQFPNRKRQNCQQLLVQPALTIDKTVLHKTVLCSDVHYTSCQLRTGIEELFNLVDNVLKVHTPPPFFFFFCQSWETFQVKLFGQFRFVFNRYSLLERTWTDAVLAVKWGDYMCRTLGRICLCTEA